MLQKLAPCPEGTGNNGSSYFSEEVGIVREKISNLVGIKLSSSVRTELIERGFFNYFRAPDYDITVINVDRGLYRVSHGNMSFLFQMYTDNQMKELAEKYFYPALSNPGKKGVRPYGYWNQPPRNVSYGGYFLDENGKEILTNPFE